MTAVHVVSKELFIELREEVQMNGTWRLLTDSKLPQMLTCLLIWVCLERRDIYDWVFDYLKMLLQLWKLITWNFSIVVIYWLKIFGTKDLGPKLHAIIKYIQQGRYNNYNCIHSYWSYWRSVLLNTKEIMNALGPDINSPGLKWTGCASHH